MTNQEAEKEEHPLFNSSRIQHKYEHHKKHQTFIMHQLTFDKMQKITGPFTVRIDKYAWYARKRQGLGAGNANKGLASQKKKLLHCITFMIFVII